MIYKSINSQDKKWKKEFDGFDLSLLPKDIELVEIDLRNMRLETLDKVEWVEFAKRLPIHLDLSINYLTNCDSIPEDTRSVLKSVDISCNQLRSFRMPLFRNLKLLNLSHNFIEELPVKAFESLGNLQELNLAKNRITHLKANCFLGVTNSLKVLCLRGNKLRVVQGLSELKCIEELDLSRNTIQDVLDLANLSVLSILDLSNNELDDIDELRHILNTMPKLVDLKLFDNPLTKDPHYVYKITDVILGIKKLDCMPINEYNRNSTKTQHLTSDLQDLLEKTTNVYMNWIADEGRRKEAVIATLQRQIDTVEKEYAIYCRKMEDDLHTHISYLQASVDDVDTFDKGYLATAEDREEWSRALAEAQKLRLEYIAKAAKQETDSSMKEAAAAATSTSFIKQLQYLSDRRPVTWQRIKQQELKNVREEKSSTADNSRNTSSNASSAMESRLQQRNLDLAKSASKLGKK